MSEKPKQPNLPGCFTGNVRTNCGGCRMIRNGTCELCTECGTTTGCS